MNPRPHIRLAQPAFEDDAVEAVAQVLRSGSLVQGAQVAAFEAAVAAFTGVAHAVACSSGTAALHLALLALELQPGDEVVIPAFGFPATANMVLACGARPVVVDVQSDTYNIDVSRLEAALTSRTRAVLVVHLFGLPAELAVIKALCDERQIPVLEDAACALGATWTQPDGAPAHVGQGTWLACLSFHPRKILTTGEGGMILTQHLAVAETLRRLRNHGTRSVAGRMVFEQVGFNYRLTEMQGALGAVEMKKLDSYIARRRALAARYDEGLRGLPLGLPRIPEGLRSVYQAYVVRLGDEQQRDAVIQRLLARGIESTIGTYALHPFVVFVEQAGLRPEDFPGADEAYRCGLALPLHQRLSEEQVDEVISALRACLE